MEPGDKPRRLSYSLNKDGEISGNVADRNQLRLLEKRIIRLTDHIRTYIDYFYTDPCPSDDPLTWGN